MTESESKLKWPIDSNRDSIAAELDKIRLPKKLQRAMWAIFQIQWPKDAPADHKPGHALIPISLPALASAMGYRSENTVRDIPFLLHGLGLIHWVKGVDGKPHLMSLNWDRLFGVEPLPPLQNDAAEIAGVQFQPPQKLQGCKIEPLQNDTPSISKLKGCSDDLLAVLTRIAVALETIAIKLPEPQKSQEKQAIQTPAREAETACRTGDNTPPQNHTPSKLQGCNFAGVQIEGVAPLMNDLMKKINQRIIHHRATPDKTAGVQIAPLQETEKPRSVGKYWSFPDPYYQITKQHLESPEHLNRMLEYAISIGKWPAGQPGRDEWFRVAALAVKRNEPGSYFKTCIANNRTGAAPRNHVPANVKTDVKSPRELSDADCLEYLKSDDWARREFLEARKAGLDPHKNHTVIAGLRRALSLAQTEVAK